MTYELILDTIEQNNLEVIEMNMPGNLKGLLLDNYIIVNKSLDTNEKKCVLAEELAHFTLNHGNILNQKEMSNRKQEKKARNYAYELLIPIERFIEAFHYGCSDFYELAEFLEVTPDFLAETLKHYSNKYGNGLCCSGYTICFDPVVVCANV